MLDVNLELLTGDNHDLIVDLACRYARSRDSIDPSWQPFFDRMGPEIDELVAAARQSGRFEESFSGAAPSGALPGQQALRLKVEALVRSFRDRGHWSAQLDALGPLRARAAPDLDLQRFDLDPNAVLSEPGFAMSKRVGDVHARLESAYCGTLALEAGHVIEDDRREWLYDAFEQHSFALAEPDRIAVLADLIRADAFEAFLSRKHPSIKRFGVEGADALIPLANTILAEAAASGMTRAVIGGMHRGRLNVLAHVARKPLERIFSALLDLPQAEEFAGFQHDVPYHVGHDGTVAFGDNTLSVSLLPHPSHLIAVSAVALGRSKAEQDERTDGVARVLPLLMHTDAAFAGQGLSSEILQLTGIDGFEVGGAIHIVVNNRIGFTTSEREGRRTPYCTDIAKAFGIPVLHVNGSDPDAVARCGRIALAFRKRFRADIIIDFNCYRLRGHNELDEPSFTQPLLYSRVAAQGPVCAAYSRTLQSSGVDLTSINGLREAYDGELLAAYEKAQKADTGTVDWLGGRWAHLHASSEAEQADADVETAVPLAKLIELGAKLTEIPEGRRLHKGFLRFQQARAETMTADGRINWATAEALAFASLLEDGFRVRLTGQDAVRGTFTQRHLRWADQQTGETGGIFDPFGYPQGRFVALNTPLTEYGVLGFEYGYSLSSPDCLTLWEAQFGDFGNVAQPIIDQFLVCGEQKWNRLSGLVLSLPHGLEGGGPDHSTGRPERFLAACAAGNITVANCTTPANYFHILRRQMLWPQRKPLVIFSPKAHLRSEAARSMLSDLAEGAGFRPTIVDPPRQGSKPRRVIFCSGRIYYDLIKSMRENAGEDCLIVRIEQLYPFPEKAVLQVLRENRAAECIWVQEEPRNLGPWSYMLDRFVQCFEQSADGRTLRYIGRPACASPAVGSKRVHLAELAGIIRRAFADDAAAGRDRPAA